MQEAKYLEDLHSFPFDKLGAFLQILLWLRFLGFTIHRGHTARAQRPDHMDVY